MFCFYVIGFVKRSGGVGTLAEMRCGKMPLPGT